MGNTRNTPPPPPRQVRPPQRESSLLYPQILPHILNAYGQIKIFFYFLQIIKFHSHNEAWVRRPWRM
jgi:hypothetical protein